MSKVITKYRLLELESESLIKLDNGTESNPSLYFTTDSDTGFYSEGVNNIAITIGGTQRISITETENIIHNNNIIDNSSTEALLVRKDSDSGDILITDTTNEQILLISSDDVSNPAYSFIGDTNTGIYNIGSDNIGIATGGTKRIDISDSQVQINQTTTSTSKDTGALIVEGGVGIEENLYVGGNINVGGDLTITGSLSQNSLGATIIDHTYTEAFLIRKDSDAGDVLITDTTNEQVLLISSDDVSNPAYSFIGDTDTGFYHIGANNIGISIGGTKEIDINSTRMELTSDLSVLGNIQTLNIDSNSTSNMNLKYNGNTEMIIGNNLVTVNNDLSISGNLTVSGTTTTLNVSTLEVEDNIIIANSQVGSDDAGFVIKRSVANIVAGDSVKETGTVSSGTSTTIFALATGASGVDTIDYYKGWAVQLTGGTVSGTSFITSSTSANPPVITIETALGGTPAGDETYNLYNKTYTGIIWDESRDKLSFYGFPQEDGQTMVNPSATDGTAGEYINIEAGSGIFQDTVILDNTGTESLLIRKNGDSGDVLIADTANEQVLLISSNDPSNPAYSFIGDTNTGIYNIGNNNIGISTSGIKRIDISDSQIQITQTTTSTSKDTGALIVEGGVGIEENLYVGGNINVTGTINITSSTTLSSTIIDSTGTETFLIRKDSDSGDVFTVNTTNEEILLEAGIKCKVSTESGTTYTLTQSDYIVEMNYSADSSNVTVTLPAISSNLGKKFIVVKTGNGGGNLIIQTASGSEYIDNTSTTSATLTGLYDRISLVGGSFVWYTI